VQVLWDAAKQLDDPALATDSSTEYLFKTVFPTARLDLGRLAKTGVARWLPSYAEMPCRWWGAPRLADIYRLAVRGYEPDGTLGALCAMANAEAVGVKTGNPISRPPVKWPRPWRTDGLLLADETAVTLLKGQPPKTLKFIVIVSQMLDFLGVCALMGEPAGSSAPRLGVIGIVSGTQLEDLKPLRVPEGVAVAYVPYPANADTGAALKRLSNVFGPGVPIVDLMAALASAPKTGR
jgi:hypothetical protein